MTTNRLGFLLLLLAAAAFALVGCGGGGGGGGGGNPDPDPDPDPDPGNALFDMSGDWLVVVYHRTATAPEDMDADDVFAATVVQSGGSVTIPSPDAAPDFTGTVEAAIYDLSRTYAEDGGSTTETVHFNLLSEDEGVGNLEWSWSNGSTTSTGTAEVFAYRLLPPEQPLSGAWDFVVVPGFSSPPGNESTPDQGQVTIAMSGNEVTLTAPDATFRGYMAGPHVWVTRSGPEDTGTTSETLRLFFGDPDNGGGEIFWRWWNASELITGQDNLNLTRAP